MIPRDMNFADPQQCRKVLDQLPLTNLPLAYETLSALIGGMQNTPPAPIGYFEILEAARTPLAFVHEQMAERYAAKPLPPDSTDDEVLRHVVGLWQAVARSYAQLARLGAQDPAAQARMATVCHRSIHYSGRTIVEYYRARRELPRGVWADLHGYFARAEELAVARTPVAESLNEATQNETCEAAYATVLLIDLANPYGRSPREFLWICRWAQRFAALVAVTPADESDPPRTYGVDLMLDHGLVPMDQRARSETLRRLDGTALAQEIQRILSKLKKKVAPSALGLGDDCQEPACGRLLLQLFRPWCLAATARRFPRRPAAGVAEICNGFEAIHYYVGGTEFVQPDHVRVYSRDEFDTIVTFRYMVDPAQPLHVHAAQMGFVLENWQVVDHSVSGFRLQRSEAGCRVEYGELIGLRPPDSKIFLLCKVSWLMFEGTGNLFAGVFVLPGTPQAIAVRPTGLAVSPSERYVRAFLLPAVEALKEKNSLVLPRGWYRPERVIEIHTVESRQVRLEELLTQGSNFDRVSFTPLPRQETPAAPGSGR